ncbi:helix-turn-helix domain-containing protein [Inconstantimicrobium mannanitabidum]|uniref:Uncharacterized protein n=1 Tax=Inconstantimicrobium mannanitabidum TaxID=1604901 RepID=A0ACB5RIN2_9CLOT|nr:helix-turn-helix transcriptional regulator [Clostridium sp. TW13]GKX68933.1 hypothetical protein rsdtw13_41910 [Clostridium sp. TW13]
MRKLFFSKNLWFLRTEKLKITQEKLAEEIGVEYSSISNYEREDKVNLPRLTTLIKMADFFSVSIDSLLFEDLEAFESSKVDLKKLGMKTLPYKDEEYKKYINQRYYAYYYNTNSAYNSELACCYFEIKPNEAKERYDVSFAQIEREKKYSGNFLLTNRHIYIYLRGIEHSERAFITLPKPENSYLKAYIGGLGIISSISSGVRRDPCSQKIFMVNKDVNDTAELNEEIRSLLSIGNNSCLIRVDLDEDARAFDLIKKINRKSIN